MKIQTTRFLVYGTEALKNSWFEGIVNTGSLLGWIKYTSRKEAKDDKKNITLHDNGFFGYTGSHTEATFSSEGELTTEKDKEKFKKELAKSFKNNGDVFWDFVISLEDDNEAERCGLESWKQWLTVVNNVLPKIAKEYKLDISNLHWWFDLHRNTEHPHIHLVFLEKKHTISKGAISGQGLANIKRFFWTEISARKDLQERVKKDCKEFFKDKDVAFSESLTKIDPKFLKKKRIHLNQLFKVLPKTGRLQYNSFHMKDFRPLLDKIIDDTILQSPELKKQMKNFMEKIDILESTMNTVGNSKVESIKEAELKKLHERVGNIILQNYKKNITLGKYRLKDDDPITKPFNPENIVVNSMKELLYKERRKRTIKKYYLTKKKLEYEIANSAFHQEQEIEKALADFYARFEENLIL